VPIRSLHYKTECPLQFTVYFGTAQLTHLTRISPLNNRYNIIYQIIYIFYPYYSKYYSLHTRITCAVTFYQRLYFTITTCRCTVFYLFSNS